MSLGWQTESALLPSKAKPIKVGDRSLLSLKAIVFEKEQQRQGAQDGEPRLKAIRKVPVAGKEKDSRVSSGRSTKSRELDDEEALREQRAVAALAAKAQLYEDILDGKVQGEASLIDFGSKRKLDKREGESVSAIKEEEEQSGSRKAAKVVQGYGPQQWQWSRGDAATHEVEGDRHDPDAVVAEWRASQQAEKAFKQEADRRLQGLPGSLSKAARVQTQWEKTLQSSAREYIKEVHQEVVDERNGGVTHPLDRRRDRLLVLQARRKEAQQAQPHSQSYHSNTSS